MSNQEKVAKEEATTESTTEKKVTTTKKVSLGKPKEKGSKWTIQRCIKAAKKFSNLNEWKAGAPSSYKSAVHHGWIEECSKFFKKTEVKQKSQLKKSA